MNSYKGVTLIEMMIAIAIAAILLAVAAPSFRSLVVKSNVESLQDDFANAVITARTEAASRGENVRVCPLAGCDSEDWAGGWIVIDSSDTEIASFPNETGYPATVHDEGEDSVKVVTFNGRGFNADETRYVFAACGPDANSATVKKGVTVEMTGRAYHTEGNSLIHKVKFDEDGATDKDLSCTQA